MEKISGILGTSPRLKSTDLQSAPPTRPGAPNFGQPSGEVTLAHRKDLTTAQKANMLREQMMEDKKRLRDQSTVEDLTGKFFMNQIEQRAMDIKPSIDVGEAEFSMQVKESSEGEVALSDLDPEEMKYMPKGYYLDRSA